MPSNQAPSHKQPGKQKKLMKTLSVLICVCLVILTCLVGYMLYATLSGKADLNKPAVADSSSEDSTKHQTASFTFTGVGDNLLHDTIFVYFEQDHGHRDFRELYEYTKPYFTDTDLAYVNFETVCAGDEFGLSGYPMFNGPSEMLDALADSGFDWFSVSSNHSLDTGMAGLQHEIADIHTRFPDISTTGAFVSEEDAATPVVRNINGIRVGLCGFTYGLNGMQKPEGADWLIDVYVNDDGSINYPLMEQKLAALNEVSDVQIIAMHWGVEYQETPTPEQQEVARFLNEKGVEAIIGTHPHVIEPVELIETPEQTTLCYYSLGNFISAQDQNSTMVGGMARFQMNYDFDTKKASFSNIQFIPTVTWISPDLRTYRTMTIHEFNDEWAANHYITALGQDISPAWVRDYVTSVIGSPNGIEVVLE